ncbi:MAG: hypothetical protein ABIT76_10575 [Chthoniobacterales bacterium]
MSRIIRRLTKNWLIPVSAIFCAVLLFLGLRIEKHTGASRYCSVCGEEERIDTWGLRGTHISLHTSTVLVETPFSSVLTSHHLVRKHTHDWQSPIVVENPDKWEGAPIISSLGNLNAPRVVSFEKNLIDYAEPAVRDNWLAILMQPDTAHVMDAALFYIGMPQDGFQSKQEFLRWLGIKLPMLATRIEVLAGRD